MTSPINQNKDRRGLIFGKTSSNFRLEKAEKVAQAVKDLDRKFEEQKASDQALVFGMPYFNLHGFPVDQLAMAAITEEQSKKAQLLPFYRDESHLKVGVVNPKNPEVQNIIQELQGRKMAVDLYLVSKSSFDQSVKIYENLRDKVLPQQEVSLLPDSQSAVAKLHDLEKMQSRINQIPATELLDILLTSAVEMSSSDIHLQPERNYVSVRFRIDGVLQQVSQFHSSVYYTVVSRIKIISHLKLNVTNAPQDGSFVIEGKDKRFEIRVSLLPSSYGEAVVMRLLGETKALKINELGMQPFVYEKIAEAVKKPNGMILTTGPTGSGKTTSLYAFLMTANKPDVKIITLENPVEYRLEGIEQIQINEKQGLTFASALRSVLRQDPDIIMVGEIRDYETADTAAQAALTGHMVYSTLHTNDAAGAIPRFLHLGVKPVILAPALSVVIAQRLVRKICQKCKIVDKLDLAVLKRAEEILKSIPPSAPVKLPKTFNFFHSPGCPECKQLGYKGRQGIYEVIEVDPDIKELIYSESSTVEIKNAAVKKGMVTMIQDGLLKALDGITDVSEVFRVVEE